MVFRNFFKQQTKLSRRTLPPRPLRPGELFVADSRNGMHFAIDAIGRNAAQDRVWQRGSVLITETNITLYARNAPLPLLHTTLASLRGYFYFDPRQHPSKMWLHLEEHGLWYILKLRFSNPDESAIFHALWRVLNAIADAPLRDAYRMRPPFIHIGAIPGYNIETEDNTLVRTYALQLFLMPIFLLVMDTEGVLLYKIPLKQISNIQTIPTQEMGMLRFMAAGAYYAFMLEDDKRLARQLSGAVQRLNAVIPLTTNTSDDII